MSSNDIFLQGCLMITYSSKRTAFIVYCMMLLCAQPLQLIAQDPEVTVLGTSSTDQRPIRNAIAVDQIHLHKMLIGIKAVLLAQKIDVVQAKAGLGALPEGNISWEPLGAVDEALYLLTLIVQGINDGVLGENLETELRLINCYNFLQEKDITPKQLRAFRSELKILNKEIKDTCRRKEYSHSKNVLEFYDHVLELNRLLTKSIIHQDYFDFSTWLLFTDVFFHRPVEFAQKHKLVTVGVILTIVVITVFLYGYSIENKLIKQNASDYGQARIAPRLAAARAILNGEGNYENEGFRCQAAFVRFLNALVQIAVAEVGDGNNGATAREFNFYRNDLQQIFMDLRNQSIRAGVRRLDVMGRPFSIHENGGEGWIPQGQDPINPPGVDIDIAQFNTLDAFIGGLEIGMIGDHLAQVV